MQYRDFGKTGCRVSTLGFGCMRLPLKDTHAAHIDVDASTRLIASAIEKGVNYIDTAYAYHEGMSEPVVGGILASLGKRKDIYLATKMPSWAVTSRADMGRFLDEQCERLKTDYIDFYLVHTLNKEYWPKLRDMGVIEFLEAKKREGRIRHMGFSFHDDLPVFLEIADAYDWEFAQIQYNYLDQEFQAGTAGFAHAVERGMGVVIMEPLRGGSLAQTPPADIQSHWDALPIKRSPADWALRWLLDKAGVSVILSGMNKQDHLDENARVCTEHMPNTLTEQEISAFTAVREAFAAKAHIACTACGYCMPCPSGVNIPSIFYVYNQYQLFKDHFQAAALYNFNMAATSERADNCVECGQCEEACPQHIAIIEELKKAHAVLEKCTL